LIRNLLLLGIRFLYWAGLPKNTYYGVRKYLITPLKLTVKRERLVFVRGVRMRLHINDWIQQQLYFLRIYQSERYETFFWERLIQPGQTILDVGANVGYYTLLAADRLGPNGVVYAFEPVNQNFHRLNDNLELNHFEHVIPVKYALGAEINRSVKIYLGQDEEWGMSSITEHSARSGHTEIIPVNTLDHFVSEYGLSQLDILKMDVEGYEPLVLQGGMQALRKYKPVLLIELFNEILARQQFSCEDVFSVLEHIGYAAFAIEKNLHLRRLSVPEEGGMIVFIPPERRKTMESLFPFDPPRSGE